MMNECGPIPTPRTGLRHALEAASNSVHTVGMVAFLSGSCGFFVGCLRLASWHHAIESAQVLAGIVSYPPQNPFFIYHTKVWSLFIQVCSVMLYCGLSERFVAYFVSGLLTMVGFQALAICAFAFCRNAFLSVAAPWVIVFCLLSGSHEFGLLYPLQVSGTYWSYGSLGLSVTFLSIALLGSGNYGVAGFLLGIAPALHVTLGLFAWLVVLIACLWNSQRIGRLLKEAAKPFCFGFAVCLASLVFHHVTVPNVPRLSPHVLDAYLAVFFQYWNVCQKPISLYSLGLWINVVASAMAVSWLRLTHDRLPTSSLFILHSLVAAGAVSVLMAATTWLPSDMVPTSFQRGIPGRFLNFDVFGCMAVVIGLVGSQRSSPARFVLTCVFLFLPLVHLSRMEIPLVVRGGVVLAFCALVSVIPLWIPKRVSLGDASKSRSPFSHFKCAWCPLVGVVLCIAITVSLMLYLSDRRQAGSLRKGSTIEDWTNEPFYARIAATGGIVATSSIPIIQLKTRRPVLLDYDITILGYTPECGPEMQRILKSVYGIDIFDPPKGMYDYGNFDHNLYRRVWEARSLKEWIDIKSKFGVTQVVTYLDWELQLPEMTRNRSYKAYAIP